MDNKFNDGDNKSERTRVRSNLSSKGIIKNKTVFTKVKTSCQISCSCNEETHPWKINTEFP